MAVTIKPDWLVPGRVRLEDRRLDSTWTQTCDHRWSQQAPQTEAWHRRATSRRRETVLDARRTELRRLEVAYEAWRDELTCDGVVQPEPPSLAGGRYILEPAARDPIVVGAPADAAPRVELEYAGLPSAEPMFTCVPLRPLELGAHVETMAELVRALLYRCARGPGGYAPDMGIAIDVELARIAPADGDQAFAIRITPALRDTRTAHLDAEGELVFGGDGWPSALRLAGRHERMFPDRWGDNRWDGTLALDVSWQTIAPAATP